MLHRRIALLVCSIFLFASATAAQTPPESTALLKIDVDHASKLSLQRTLLATSDKSVMQDVTFSSDNKWLAVIERDSSALEGKVRFWDAATFAEKSLFEDKPLQAMSIAFSPDSWYLAAGTDTGKVIIADMRRNLIRTVVEADPSTINAVAINPGDQFIAVASGNLEDPNAEDFVFRVMNFDTGEEGFSLKQCENSCSGVSVSFDLANSLVASTTSDGTVRLWDFELGEVFATLDKHVPSVNDMLFTPDGNALIYVATDGIRIWNIKALFQKDGKKNDFRVIAPPAAGEVIQSITLNPDGTVLAVGYSDSTIQLWNVATGEQLIVLTGHADRVASLAFNPDGILLASGGTDGTVRLWGVAVAG